MQLKNGTLLQGGKYRIESVLGKGGFGITYLACQTGLNRKVAVKEFFMSEYCERQDSDSHVSVPSSGSREMVDRFRTKFVKEAQTIADLRNPHIVPIHDIFDENGTSYYVMEYVYGGSLGSLVGNGVSMPLDLALKYVLQVAEALKYCHERKIVHLDVKPGNILIQDGTAILIDFGISKHYDEGGEQTSSTPVGISKGYAPLEQYKRGGVVNFSPVTDIYSLGAVLYRLVTGQTPPDADEVNEDGLPEFPSEVPQYVCAAIIKSMSPKKKDRPQSVDDFVRMLEAPVDDEKTIFHADQSQKQTVSQKQFQKPRPGMFKIILGVAVALIVLICFLIADRPYPVNITEPVVEINAVEEALSLPPSEPYEQEQAEVSGEYIEETTYVF